jgi:hypothetical protein
MGIAKFDKVPYEQFLEDYKKVEDISEDLIKSVFVDVQLPTRASKGSAGYDFRSTRALTIMPGEVAVIPSGVRCRMNEDWVLLLAPRSSLGFKYHMFLTNTIGVIDSDYHGAKNYGHIMIEIKNTSNKPMPLKIGERFCQGIFIQYGVTDDDKAEGKRTGGMGSTGQH